MFDHFLVGVFFVIHTFALKMFSMNDAIQSGDQKTSDDEEKEK